MATFLQSYCENSCCNMLNSVFSYNLSIYTIHSYFFPQKLVFPFLICLFPSCKVKHANHPPLVPFSEVSELSAGRTHGAVYKTYRLIQYKQMNDT